MAATCVRLDPMKALSDAVFRDLCQLMYSAVGLSFPPTKKPLIASRLGPRITKLGLAGFEDYLALILRDDGGEFQQAVDLLTTNETYFLREPQHFALLERELAQSQRGQWRVWSAACSFGDEAYSLAMVLADAERRGAIDADWSVLGTDISDRVLRHAVRGVYPQERLRHVAPERLQRYCLRGEGSEAGFAMVRTDLRERVRFGQLNLSQPIDHDLGPFDAIFLRNVLIYFDPPTKRAVVDRVVAQLRPGGLLFLGMAEGRVASEWTLEPLEAGVFRKAPA